MPSKSSESSRKASRKSSRKPLRTSLTTRRPKSIRDLKRRKVDVENLIKIPVEVDGDGYVLYSRHLSLGAARSFTALSRMDEDDPTRGAESINVAANFLETHIRDEDGTELPDHEIRSIIDSLDLEFATKLAKSMIDYIMNALGSANDGDDDSDHSDDNDDKVIEVDSGRGKAPE